MERRNNKEQNSWDPSVKLVTRADESTLEGEGILKPEMSCGHAFMPTSIKQWCTLRLDKSQPLSCPECSAKWTYTEVCKAGLLTTVERRKFEESLCFQLAPVKFQTKQCPFCNNLIEREDKNNLCVHCIICSEEMGKDILFCWNCLKEWRGPYPRSDKCDNTDCRDPKLKLLSNCSDITLENVPGVRCPSVRACPKCWTLVEHNRTKCKNITCPNCQVEFCFLCLKLTTVCCRDGGWYNLCPGGIAPRQTKIGTELRPQVSPLKRPAAVNPAIVRPAIVNRPAAAYQVQPRAALQPVNRRRKKCTIM